MSSNDVDSDDNIDSMSYDNDIISDSNSSDIDYFNLINHPLSYMNQLCNYVDIPHFTRTEIDELAYHLKDNNYFSLLLYNVKFDEMKYLFDELYVISYLMEYYINQNVFGTYHTKYILTGDHEFMELVEYIINVIMQRNKEYQVEIHLTKTENDKIRLISYTIRKIE